MSTTRGNLKKYQSKNPLQRYLIQNFLKRVEANLNTLPHNTLCEVGCGEGFALRSFFDHGTLKGSSVTGVDLDPEAIKFASNFIPEVKLQQGSAYALPFKDKSFQTLMMLEVLEHLESPEKALKEASRVADNLLLSVPHEPWFRTANFLRGKNLSRLGNDPEHINWWNISSFKNLLKPYGTLIKLEAPFPWILAAVKT